VTVSTPPGIRSLTAGDVMSAPVVTATPDSSPWAAWSTMATKGVRHLVVTVGERCVGMVDDREIFAQWPMGPLAMRRLRIESIMRARTTVVLPDTDLRDVARVMVDDRVDAVPVVDTDGRLRGLITATDMVACVAARGVMTHEGDDACE
jgi:acetoin utilization protein AcuB